MIGLLLLLWCVLSAIRESQMPLTRGAVMVHEIVGCLTLRQVVTLGEYGVSMFGSSIFYPSRRFGVPDSERG